MRVWRSQDILIVQNLGSNCAVYLHLCSPRTVADNFRFYDIRGKNAANPKFLAEYDPSSNPHEFFLWEDPDNKKRALMFGGSAGGQRGVHSIWDISAAAGRRRARGALQRHPWVQPLPGVPGARPDPDRRAALALGHQRRLAGRSTRS